MYRKKYDNKLKKERKKINRKLKAIEKIKKNANKFQCK